MEVIEVLRNQSPFSDMAEAELAQVASTFFLQSTCAGTVLVEQDHPVVHSGLIVKGSADLCIRGFNRSIMFGSISEGDYFGMMSFQRSALSMISVITRESCEILVQNREDFMAMTGACPRIREYFYKMSLNRIWMAYERLNQGDAIRQTGSNRKNRQMENVRKSLNYIDSNYMYPLVLERVAMESGMSKYHFSRVFKARTGLSFKEYLTMKRIAAAKQLLTAENMNISETCYRVGFNDISYFCRVFRKLEGVTPTVYKRTTPRKRRDEAGEPEFALKQD